MNTLWDAWTRYVHFLAFDLWRYPARLPGKGQEGRID
jgi:hypothetical protein